MLSKILITGSNGLLGQKLVNLFSKIDAYQVFAISRGDNRNETAVQFTYHNIDITDAKKLENFIENIEPHFIINCAAMTNVDECEKEQTNCSLINVKAVETLVNCAKRYDTHLIHISTDFIFDGENGPYNEDDTPNPINYYGLSKLKAEEIIVQNEIKHTILRTILVYGIVDNMSRNNIVSWVKSAIENKQQITIVDDQFRMPTLVDDLAEACLLAIQNKAYGIYNVSSNELLSIYEMALQIAEVFDLDASFIKAIPTSQLNQPAKRPPKTGFVLDKSRHSLKFFALPFKERLQVFKNQLLNTNN